LIAGLRLEHGTYDDILAHIVFVILYLEMSPSVGVIIVHNRSLWNPGQKLNDILNEVAPFGQWLPVRHPSQIKGFFLPEIEKAVKEVWN